MAQYNFKTNDKDVIDFLNEAKNKSQVIVMSLKEKRMAELKPREPIKVLNTRRRKVLKVLKI